MVVRLQSSTGRFAVEHRSPLPCPFACFESRGGVQDDKTISRTASRIFRRAGVYAVNGEKSRHATLHDLRRTFGKRMTERYRNP